MKNYLMIITALVGFGVQAASVGTTGYTNNFSAQPAASDWATLSISGSSTTSSTSNDLATAMQALAASAINAQLGADAANPPGAVGTAVWSSGGQYVQARPTGNNATALMVILQNSSGEAASRITLSYDAGIQATVAEPVPGFVAFYSLTGAAGSWVAIPEFSAVQSGRPTAQLNITWPAGGLLYVVWVDDNADGGTDEGNTIDNFSATLASAVQVPATITKSPTNLTVGELATATFVAAATGNPAPAYQWYRGTEALAGATESTLVVEDVPLAWNQSQFRVVAFNTVSNVTQSATSQVAVLTVRADTNAPTLADVFAVGDARLQVVYSERVTPATATNLTAYSLTNANGSIAIFAATLDSSGTIVYLDTAPLQANASHTLKVSNVTDRSAAANAVAPNTVFNFVAYSYVPANVGNPTLPGSVTSVSGGVNITGGGTSVGGATDQFMFYYQQRGGDFDVQVRVSGLSLSDAWAKAGLMARETLDNNARYTAVFATPTISGVFAEYRASVGAAATRTAPFPPNYPQTWLRLRRQGSLFTFFAGVDGSTWYQLGSATIPLQTTVYLGYAACASATNAVTVAEFRNLGDVVGGTISSGTPPREPSGPSSRRSGLSITEIMYNPRQMTGPSGSMEFVEIFNSNPFFEDISNFKLSGDIEFTFPANTIMPAGGIIVVAKNPDTVQNYYNISNVYGAFKGTLPNTAGLVQLRNAAGGVVQQIEYSSEPPWPVAADGTGHSMVLSRPSYGENNYQAWDISAYIDGSPGRIDPYIVEPANAVVINEILANSTPPAEDYVELYNFSNQEVDLSGMWLTDKRGIMFDATITNKFRIPDGTRLAPRGHVVFTQTTLNFALASDGESLLLVNSNLNRVVDYLRFEGQPLDIASGRYPDGTPGIHALQAQTPGTNNAPFRIHDIVINELMYNPISGDDNDEYVELYNKGASTVDLGRWRFVEGIDFRFPPNASLAPGAYLVIAKNVTNLLAKYPQLNSANTIGNYGGTLANGGERLALAMPEYRVSTNDFGLVVTNVTYITVEEVTYFDSGRWGSWSDGGGSSLELIDPRSDNRLAYNWADSEESQKAPWTNVVWTQLADHIYPVNADGARQNEIHVFNLGRGEFLMDDVVVRLGTNGPNVLSSDNSTFASIGGWVIQGNHVASRTEPAGPGNPSQSLRVISSAGGDNGANKVEADLTTELAANNIITIEAKLRWLRGHRDVLLRLHGGAVEASVTMPVASNLGTPGQVNSRATANAGPAIVEVNHSPVLPDAGVQVAVTARLHDPDGVGSVQLRYRPDGGAYTTVTMVDNGTSGDAKANDGVFTGIIPGQGAGTLIAFYVQATDRHGSPASTVFPKAAPTSECLVRFGDLQITGNFGVYRLWMTSARYNTWSSRERLSNEALEGTFVYGNYRVIYLAGARYRGSPFTRNPANPLVTGVNFVWSLPEDDPLLGSDELNLDSLEPTGRDATALRELTAFTMAEQLRLPFSYQRFVSPVINGSKPGSPIYTDSQQPNRDYIQMWFSDADQGDIYKVDDWFEFADTLTGSAGTGMQGNKSASLERFTTTGGVKKKARYRWSWEKKFNGGLNDDYSSLFAAVEGLNAPDATYISSVEEIIDSEEWLTALALRHVLGDWDGYGYNRGKNQFVYYPEGGRFNMLLWDLDFSLGCTGGHGPQQNLFTVATEGASGGNNMPEVARMYNNPYFRRIYLRALQRCADYMLTDPAFMPKLDARYQSLLANGISTTSPYVGSGAQSISIPAWIQQRRTYVLQNVPQAAFGVTSPASQTSSNNVATITGNAPVTVKSIRVNGQLYPVTWGANYTSWSLSLVGQSPTNTFVIEPCDFQDQPIAGLATTNTFIYTGTTPSAAGTVVFSEIKFRPAVTNSEYVELYNASADYTFDLSNWRVNGLDYTFPIGAIIRPQQRVVLVKNQTAFLAAHPGSSVSSVIGQFSGNLDADGETLTLFKPGADGEEVVDRVRFEPNAPWPARAVDGTAAMQLVDARRDTSRPLNWADGDGWKYKQFTVSNVVTLTFTNLQLRPSSAGEIYIDDLRIEEGREFGAGSNLVVNGDFEAPLAGTWRLGTYVQSSSLSTEIKRSGNSSLRLVATNRAAVPAQTIAQTLILKTNTVYTISLWFLPSTTITGLELYVTALYVRSNITVGSSSIFQSPGAENPTEKALPDLPLVYLNEVQPENTAGLADNFGEREPWVEIYNRGATPVDLTGWYLTDNYTNLAQWPFPAGTVLQPGEFRLVWCDGQPQQTAGTNLHANFRIAAGAGSVALVMPLPDELGVLDYLNYANLAADASYGEYPDGQMFYRQQFHYPSPGVTNNPTKPLLTTLTINEWMASNTRTLQEPNGLLFEDWFELYNASDEPVDLAGYFLTDAPAQAPQKFQIPSGYVIPARGFLLVWADNSPQRNNTNDPTLHVNFALSRNGDDIALYDPIGRSVDTVIFGAQTSDVSQGRYVDGTANVVFMSTPTPGQSNIYQAEVEQPKFIGGGVDVANGLVSMSLQTTPGARYQVQYKDRLTDAQWTNLERPVTAPGAILIISDTVGNRTSRFYRVILAP